MYDVAVLGGGPAGMAAASRAAEGGARVVLFDEQARPGGQVYRAPRTHPRPRTSDARIGDRLRARLAASGAEIRCSQRVWGLGGGPLVAAGQSAAPFRIDTVDDAEVTAASARTLILCPGATERVIPFEGWTLPGVFGLAAATILLKAEHVLPGERIVVAGTGPLLAAVAAAILRRGGQVAAIVDASAGADWIAAAPALIRAPHLLTKGALWLSRIAQARTPLFSSHRVVRAHGSDRLTAIDVVSLAGGAEQRIDCDALCIGHGLVPATEAARLFGAAVDFRPERGGWTVRVDEGQRTSVERLYAAGDGAGISGAASAPSTGATAADSALIDLGLAHGNGRRPRRSAVGTAMAKLMAPPDALIDAIPPACIVCRCEDVTRAEIETAVQLGARDLNQLKQFTRCGMGPCQGRMCGEAAAELLGRHVGGRAAAGLWTPRIPLRPVPMEALLGSFDYADIPIPAPAPI